MEEMLTFMADAVAKQEMNHVSRTLSLFLDAPKVVDDLSNDVVSELIYPIAKGVIEECHKEREIKIKAIKQKQILRMKMSTFKSWRKYVIKRKSQRSILENFPCMPSSNKTLLQDSSIKATSIRNTLKVRKQVDQLHKVIELEDKILELTILEPMNELPNELQHLKQWKLIICTPTLESDSIGKGLVEMVKKKLCINASAMTDQDYDSNVLTSFSAPLVSMCARWIDSEMIEEDITYSEKKRREYLTGTSAILFLHIEEEESIDEAK